MTLKEERPMWRLIVILGLLVPGVALGADATAGGKIAAEKCAGCHGTGGAGDGPLLQSLNVTTPPVPWTDKAKMAAFSDQQITDMVENGGKAAGKSPLMPAFGKQLSASQIADVVAYVQSLAQ
jgi:mono/diheme cytochrome c family protein